MIKPGMIGFSNNKKGFLPAAIRYFTDSNISHSLLITRDFGGMEQVQEAGMVVQQGPFQRLYREDPTQDYWIFNPIKATQEQKLRALDHCFKEYACSNYGHFQLLWFVYRWGCVKILRQDDKEVTKRDNWLSRGVICSELVYDYLVQLGGEYAELVKDFNQDTIQAEDIRRLVVSRPDLFQLIEKKTEEEFKRP